MHQQHASTACINSVHQQVCAVFRQREGASRACINSVHQERMGTSRACINSMHQQHASTACNGKGHGRVHQEHTSRACWSSVWCFWMQRYGYSPPLIVHHHSVCLCPGRRLACLAFSALSILICVRHILKSWLPPDRHARFCFVCLVLPRHVFLRHVMQGRRIRTCR